MKSLLPLSASPNTVGLFTESSSLLKKTHITVLYLFDNPPKLDVYRESSTKPLLSRETYEKKRGKWIRISEDPQKYDRAPIPPSYANQYSNEGVTIWSTKELGSSIRKKIFESLNTNVK